MLRSGVADLGLERRHGRRQGRVDLLVAIGAQVEHADLGKGAEGEATVEPGTVTQRGRGVHAHRHPLVVGPVGAGAALEVVALPGLAAAGGVVLRAVLPLVVGDLVVVPRDDPGVLRVQVLQVGVALVLGVPLPVVGQRHHLVGRLVLADVDVVGAVAVLAGAVLVEVVAEVEHRVQVVALGEAAIGGEPPGLEVGTGDDTEPQVPGGGPGGRRGAHAADPADRAAVGEAVEVPGRGLQPSDVELDGVVAAGAGREGAAAHGRAEEAVLRDLPGDVDLRALAGAGGAGRRRGDPGPDHHAVGLGVAGGHTVLEVAGAGERRRVGRGGRHEGGRAGSGGGAAGQDRTTAKGTAKSAHDTSQRARASEVMLGGSLGTQRSPARHRKARAVNRWTWRSSRESPWHEKAPRTKQS